MTTVVLPFGYDPFGDKRGSIIADGYIFPFVVFEFEGMCEIKVIGVVGNQNSFSVRMKTRTGVETLPRK